MMLAHYTENPSLRHVRCISTVSLATFKAKTRYLKFTFPVYRFGLFQKPLDKFVDSSHYHLFFATCWSLYFFISCSVVRAQADNIDIGNETLTGFFGLFILFIDIWLIIKLISSDKHLVTKVLLSLLVLLLPLIGAFCVLIFLLFSPKKREKSNAHSAYSVNGKSDTINPARGVNVNTVSRDINSQSPRFSIIRALEISAMFLTVITGIGTIIIWLR